MLWCQYNSSLPWNSPNSRITLENCWALNVLAQASYHRISSPLETAFPINLSFPFHLAFLQWSPLLLPRAATLVPSYHHIPIVKLWQAYLWNIPWISLLWTAYTVTGCLGTLINFSLVNGTRLLLVSQFAHLFLQPIFELSVTIL